MTLFCRLARLFTDDNIIVHDAHGRINYHDFIPVLERICDPQEARDTFIRDLFGVPNGRYIIRVGSYLINCFHSANCVIKINYNY